jgi:hypothetical protein
VWYRSRVQKLTKRDRKRFDDVCRRIRGALHLEHWRVEYRLTSKDENIAACCYLPPTGYRRVWIDIHKGFWEATGESQLRTLIHEHVHALLSPYDQAGKELIQRLHASDQELASTLHRNAASEQVTDHLESVLFDLLRDRL